MPIPAFAYPGGKAKIRKKIIPLLPPEGVRYVEPFCGRGNMYFAVVELLDYREFWLNDLMTWPFLEGLRTSWKFAIPDWQNPENYKRMRARLEDRKRLWTQPAPLLEPYLTFNGGGYKKAGIRGMNKHKGGKSQEGMISDVKRAHEIMRDTKPLLTRLDYRKVLEQCGSNDIVYL
jgi:site-specific DNA-adenine methylase